MANDIQTVTSSDTTLLSQTESKCKDIITYGEKGSNNVMAVRTLLTSTTLCEVLHYLGRQKCLIQKVPFNTVLIGLELNLNTDGKEILSEIASFKGSHLAVAHGTQDGALPITTTNLFVEAHEDCC